MVPSKHYNLKVCEMIKYTRTTSFFDDFTGRHFNQKEFPDACLDIIQKYVKNQGKKYRKIYRGQLKFF